MFNLSYYSFDPKNRKAQAGIDNIDCAGANPAASSKPSACFLSPPGADDTDVMSLDVDEPIDASDTDEVIFINKSRYFVVPLG